MLSRSAQVEALNLLKRVELKKGFEALRMLGDRSELSTLNSLSIKHEEITMEMNLPYKTVDGMSAVSWSVNKLVDERANKHVEFGDAILEAFASTILVGSDGETRECVLRKQKQNTPTRSQTRFTCRRRRANGSIFLRNQNHVASCGIFT